MADGVKIDASLGGLDSVFKALRDVDKKVRNKVMDKGTQAAAKPILESAREKCPLLKGASPNLLRDSLGTKKLKYRRGAVVTVSQASRNLPLSLTYENITTKSDAEGRQDHMG